MSDLFSYARTLRDDGMSRAADAQERERPFKDEAYAAILRVATRQPEVFVDDVLRECPARPEHSNAWGSVWQRAIRAGVIARTGRVAPCRTDAGKHCHQYPIYRSNLFLGVAHD